MDLDSFPPWPLAEPDSEDGFVPAEPFIDLRRAVDRTALLRAYETLTTGCAFIVAHAENSGKVKPHPAYARLIGNRLHELDRFLSVMIDEASALLEGPRPDGRFFAKMRNTPEKLRRLAPLRDLHSEIGPRLAAIGRVSAYLRYCRDGVHRTAHAEDILIANGVLEDGMADGEKPRKAGVEASTMIAIARLYRSMGDVLLAAVNRTAP